MATADRITQLEKAIIGLRSLVLSGELEASARLPEVSVAGRLGISRTPLRQAMDRLVAEGLLERVPSGGCRVARFDVADIADAIELRGVIEGTAARLAAERGADPALMAAAERILDEIDAAVADTEAVDLDAYATLNAQFHALLAQLPASPVIHREVERISGLPLASPSAFLQEQEMIPDFQRSIIRAQSQHRALLEAIAGREGARAEALAREHARLAHKNLAFLSSQEPRIARRVPGLALVTPT